MKFLRKRKKYSDILSSGDLLLFEGDSYTSKMISFFTSSKISHAAIVWKCPITKKLYMFSCGRIAESSLPIISKYDCPYNGTHLIPITKNSLSEYKKVYVRKLISEKEIDSIKFDKFIANNLGKFYTANLVPLWTQRCNPSVINFSFLEELGEDYKSDNYNEWMCSQLVLLTYYNLDIVKFFDSHTSSITPGDMFDDIVTNYGYDFKKPIVIHKKRK